MNSQKKQLLVIKTSNVIDVITNSSSELFVLNAETTDIVKEMVGDIYPNYLNEYHDIVALRDALPEDIDTYFEWVENPWHMENDRSLSDKERRQKQIDKARMLAEKFKMEPEKFYHDWEDTINGESPYVWLNKTDDALKKIGATLDPKGQIFLMYSIDENPDWDMQEKLMNIATRYHLG